MSSSKKTKQYMMSEIRVEVTGEWRGVSPRRLEGRGASPAAGALSPDVGVDYTCGRDNEKSSLACAATDGPTYIFRLKDKNRKGWGAGFNGHRLFVLDQKQRAGHLAQCAVPNPSTALLADTCCGTESKPRCPSGVWEGHPWMPAGSAIRGDRQLAHGHGKSRGLRWLTQTQIIWA